MGMNERVLEKGIEKGMERNDESAINRDSLVRVSR